jgi:hypothetical protein
MVIKKINDMGTTVGLYRPFFDKVIQNVIYSNYAAQIWKNGKFF